MDSKTIMNMLASSKGSMGIDSKTLKNYNGIISKFSEEINKDIEKADEKDVDKYFSNLYYKGYKETTINLHKTTIKMLYKFLMDKKIITENPAAHLRFNIVMWRPKFFTEDEMWRVMKSAKSPLEKAVLSFLFGTGLRADEAGNIKKENINWNRKIVFVPAEIAKGNKERETMISTHAIDAIKAYLKTKRDGSPYVFSHDGEKYSYQTFLNIIKRCARRSGVFNERKDMKIGVHTTRHTFSTTFLNHDGTITDLAKMLGHFHKDGRINTQMTERYIEVLTGRLEKAAKSHFMDEERENV
jgi:integrase/recombinase XerD